MAELTGNEDAEIEMRMASGWLSKEEGHRLKTLLKMGEVPERTADKAKETEFWTHSTTVMLKNILLHKEFPTAFTKFLSAIGVKYIRQKIKEHDLRRADPEYVNRFPRMDALVHSDRFESAMGLIMLANAVMIGFQVSQEEKSAAGIYTVLDFIFTVCFVVELFVRALPEGWRWWCKASNIFDVIIVLATNVIPVWILLPLGIDNAVMRPFAVLRLFRAVKLGRLIRKYRRLKILWNLFQGMIGSGRILAYTLLMLGTTLFIFAVFVVVLITKNPATKDHPMVIARFQTVPEAFFTLFQIITLDSWMTELARPLGDASPLAAMIIVSAVLLVEMCLLNLVAATILNAAFERQAADYEMVAREKKEKNDKLIDDIRTLFGEMDKRGTGKLTYEEYMEAVGGNEVIQTKFVTLGIEDADELWNLIDMGNGEIAVSQFAAGLRIISEETKAKDVFTINRRVGNAERSLDHSVREMNRQIRQVQKFEQEIAEITQHLTMASRAILNLMHSCGRCIPPGQVQISEKEIEEHQEKLLKKVRPLLGTHVRQVSRLFRKSHQSHGSHPSRSRKGVQHLE
ncbi:L type [Durusdinium trenchii]|uniref:L type n=1 Tax=Durusdinium trenchii TaxID=1381693 RepID=A0ABP0PFZ1_9DINO